MKNNNSKSTLQRLLVIAVPMVISQASDTIMLFADRLFLSRLGGEYLAASMSGGLTQLMLSFFFVGTIGYVTAVVAQNYGAGRSGKCAEATFQAVILALISYPLMLAAAPAAKIFMAAIGQSALQVELAYTYFQTLVIGIIFLVLRHALAGFFIGIGRTRVVMAANAAGMLVNLPLNYILIFGKLGLPAMGLRGAAIGTICGNFIIFLILLVSYLNRSNREEFSTHKSLRLQPAVLKTLLKFGVPAGIEMFLTIAAFNLFVQTMHTYGTQVAASVTVAFNWDLVAFLPMLGMGHAVTSLVGRNVGAGDPAEARRTAYMGLRVAWVYSFTMLIIFVFGARLLVGVFLPGGEADGEVFTMAVTMLRLVSLYILADSAQIVFVGALRGAGDTRWVMTASVILHWLFAAVVFYLIRILNVTPLTAWLFFIGFLIILSLSMFLRFRSGKWMRIKMIAENGDLPEHHYSSGACLEIIAEEPVSGPGE
ncbi:MAG: MATE family efflux transporter [Spirochaetales bacterium]|nr:MATE family efflux transporter [Spirochaetales bacterium]